MSAISEGSDTLAGSADFDPAQAWADARLEFRAWLVEHGRTSSTAEGYGRHVGALAKAYPLVSPWDLSRSQVETWLDGRGWSRSTYSRALVSLRNFYGWAAIVGYCEWSPVAGVQLPDTRRSGPARTDLPTAWEAMLGDYLQHLRAGARSQATVDQNRHRLMNLARYSADPLTITAGQLLDWLASPGLSPATRRGRRSTVTSFYAWAVKTGRHPGPSPAVDLPVIRERRALPRPAPDAVLRDAIAQAEDMERLAIKLAAYAGLRRAEVARLHFSAVSGDVLHVVGKGGHHRRVPLVPDLAQELAAEQRRRAAGRPGAGFPRCARADGYVFPSVGGADEPLTAGHLAKRVMRFLPDGWTMHTLRHRFATAAYGAQRDLRAVQELLGHSKPETTARYAAVPDGALAAAVAAVTL